ncbi:MAG TPA: hypothetical protein VGF48_01520 [Thermoanaerobaculia bacterium]|jgi:hypothetical protein
MIKKRLAPALLSVLIAGLASAQESNRLLIPAAGDVPGANGTHFRSDISITNLRDVDQMVMLTWIPRAGSGSPVSGRGILIPARATVQSDNFVTEFLGERGLGSIEIEAIGSSVPRATDAAGRLYATSRIWTRQPNSAGTVSQSLPAVPYTEIVHEHTRFTGHRTGPQFRTNLGIVNLLNDVTQNYAVTVTGSVQTFEPLVFFVEVPPLSMQQVPIDWPEDPKLVVDVQALRQPNGGFGTLWMAYLSTVDNITGDSWSTTGVELEP